MHKQSEMVSYSHIKSAKGTVVEGIFVWLVFCFVSYRANSLYRICLCALSVAISYPFTLATYLLETQFEPNTSVVDNNAVLLRLPVASVKLKMHDFLTRNTTTHLEFGDGSKN